MAMMFEFEHIANKSYSIDKGAGAMGKGWRASAADLRMKQFILLRLSILAQTMAHIHSHSLSSVFDRAVSLPSLSIPK